MTTPLSYRLACLEDVPALEALITLSCRGLQSAHYTEAQLDEAIGTVFGVDSQLIRDGTYYVAEAAGKLVACGGWSRRKTLYGGDKAKVGEDPLRDPATEPAMIRAFFVHPDFARRGIGRHIVHLCEEAARQAGFRDLEMIATLAGQPLYAACGYEVMEEMEAPLPNQKSLRVIRMGKRVA